MKEAPKFNAPGRQGRASALCVQARNWLPWQSVKVRSKGCLKTMAFRSKDGKQHLSFLALELGDRGNNSYYIDRESFEFYIFAPDQTGCSWKADVPSGFLCDTNLIKIVAPETPESTKLRKKQIPGRKSGATQKESWPRDPVILPCMDFRERTMGREKWSFLQVCLGWLHKNTKDTLPTSHFL